MSEDVNKVGEKFYDEGVHNAFYATVTAKQCNVIQYFMAITSGNGCENDLDDRSA